MVDTVTEFINVTGKTYSELVAGVPLVTNSSTDQAVVKDVVISNTKNKSLQLTVGNAVVAQTSASARFQGSELLGSSSTLSLKTASIAVMNRLRWFDSTSTAYDSSFPTLFSTDSVPASITGNSSSLSIGSSFSVVPYFAVFAANGDFYYSNNGGGSLYRRAGGVDGAQTTITSRGYSCSYDGRYIYSFNTTSGMAITDTQNNGSVVQRDYTGLSGISSTSSFSAAIDGYVWLHRSYDDVCYLINPSTGVGVALGGQTDGNGFRYFVGIGKNSAGDYIAIQTIYGGMIYWWNFGPSLATPVIKASGGYATNLGASYNSNVNSILRVEDSSKYLFLIAGDGGANTAFNLDSVTTPSNFSFNLSPASQSGKVLSATSSVSAADFGLIDVRATGIKTTP